MRHVLAHFGREVPTNGAWISNLRVRGTHHRAPSTNDTRAFSDGSDERSGGDELDQIGKERLSSVLAVMLLGQLGRDRALLKRDEARWRSQRWHLLVLDEAQNIKNASTHAALEALVARQLHETGWSP